MESHSTSIYRKACFDSKQKQTINSCANDNIPRLKALVYRFHVSGGKFNISLKVFQRWKVVRYGGALEGLYSKRGLT
jgi:hypothetical protein